MPRHSHSSIDTHPRLPSHIRKSPGKSKKIPHKHKSTPNVPESHVFYTETQHHAYSAFKSTEYHILKDDKYAKDKHLYNERQLEPTFLSLLRQECDNVSDSEDSLALLLSNLESYSAKFKTLKQKISQTEKQLKEHKQRNAVYFSGAGSRPEKILPQIQQNKQKLDFLRDTRARCEKLRRTNQDLRARVQQFQDDAGSGMGSSGGAASGATASLHESLVHEMMISRAMSMLPLKVHLIDDRADNEEIRVNCALNEYQGAGVIQLSLALDRMNGKLKDVHIFQQSQNDHRVDITSQYKEIVEYSIERNDLEFLVGELYAAVCEQDSNG